MYTILQLKFLDVKYNCLFFQGYLLNWDVQKTVWDYIFSKDCCKANFTEAPLIVTEPYFNFSSIQEGMTEIFFEEYEFQALLRTNGKLFSFHYSIIVFLLMFLFFFFSW